MVRKSGCWPAASHMKMIFSRTALQGFSTPLSVLGLGCVQKKDTEEQLRAYIKQLSRFTELQIEVIKDGSIKAIHYIFPVLNP